MLNDQNNPSIFNLSVDDDAKYSLKEIAKWARFLAIVGIVMLGILVLAGVAISFTALAGLDGLTVMFLYLVLAGIYAYPIIMLLKFGKGMKEAIRNNDQLLMNRAIRYLKNCFQYVGISTLLFISLYAVIIIIFIIFRIVNL